VIVLFFDLNSLAYVADVSDFEIDLQFEPLALFILTVDVFQILNHSLCLGYYSHVSLLFFVILASALLFSLVLDRLNVLALSTWCYGCYRWGVLRLRLIKLINVPIGQVFPFLVTVKLISGAQTAWPLFVNWSYNLIILLRVWLDLTDGCWDADVGLVVGVLDLLQVREAHLIDVFLQYPQFISRLVQVRIRFDQLVFLDDVWHRCKGGLLRVGQRFHFWIQMVSLFFFMRT